MISIDLKSKIKSIGLTVDNFHKKYTELILNHSFNTCVKGNYKFGLGPTAIKKMYLHEIFFAWYQRGRGFASFIDYLFDGPVADKTKAKSILNSILIASPDKIETYVAKINAYPQYKSDATIKRTLEYIFDYDRDNKSRIRPSFTSLDFSVCYYCNRNYISNFKVSKVKRSMFTLDHYYQKDKYPIFALSLYNLIPSCSSCNTNVKGTREVEQYKNPYSQNYDFHAKAKFRFYSGNKFKISSHDTKCDKYITDFYINEIYDHHKAEVNELIRKRQVFTDDMMLKLADLIKLPIDNVRALIFGDVIQLESLDISPLSKLKIDLARELKIIK